MQAGRQAARQPDRQTASGTSVSSLLILPWKSAVMSTVYSIGMVCTLLVRLQYVCVCFIVYKGCVCVGVRLRCACVQVLVCVCVCVCVRVRAFFLRNECLLKGGEQ